MNYSFSLMELGDQIPDISLPDQNGEAVRLHDHIGKHPLVIYFYPKDDTPGCTREACRFRDQFDEFTEAGAKVFGISTDSVDSHKRFASKYRLNFQLLSDRGRKAEKAFGLKRGFLGMLPGRATFVFDSDGLLIREFNSSLQPTRHVAEALEALKAKTNTY